MQTIQNRDPILNKPQAATYCGLSVASVDRLREDDLFAEEIALSARRLGWRQSALDKWLASRVVKRAEKVEQIEAPQPSA